MNSSYDKLSNKRLKRKQKSFSAKKMKENLLRNKRDGYVEGMIRIVSDDEFLMEWFQFYYIKTAIVNYLKKIHSNGFLHSIYIPHNVK
jgi:hypothetical protein